MVVFFTLRDNGGRGSGIDPVDRSNLRASCTGFGVNKIEQRPGKEFLIGVDRIVFYESVGIIQDGAGSALQAHDPCRFRF
jgi:hypothetical protein